MNFQLLFLKYEMLGHAKKLSFCSKEFNNTMFLDNKSFIWKRSSEMVDVSKSFQILVEVHTHVSAICI